MKDLINDIIVSLHSLKDEKRVDFAKRTYPSSMRVIGVTNPNCKMIMKELRVSSKDFTQKQKLELIKQLFKTCIFECQFIAIEYLGHEKKLLLSLSQQDLDQLNQNMDNWVSVDTFSTQVLGIAWRQGIVSDQYIIKLLNSKDVWQRRIAVVCTIALNLKSRGGQGDSFRTLMICQHVIEDHHKMIHKALSWSLRELIKSDRDAVIEFVQKNHEKLHPSVIREVNNKLEYKLKTPRR